MRYYHVYFKSNHRWWLEGSYAMLDAALESVRVQLQAGVADVRVFRDWTLPPVDGVRG